VLSVNAVAAAAAGAGTRIPVALLKDTLLRNSSALLFGWKYYPVAGGNVLNSKPVLYGICVLSLLVVFTQYVYISCGCMSGIGWVTS